MYYYELHMHTSDTSRCGRSPAADMVAAYKQKGFTGVVVTDHLMNVQSHAEPEIDWNRRVEKQLAGYYAALEAGEGQADTWQDAVQLMTLHSAKGLEFPQVFIVGVEEGMFPSQMALDEGGRLEEERRLAYVGVTRAMQKLTLTYAETRRLYGKEVYHRPSRFIGELPQECVEEVRLRATVSRPVNHQRLGAPIAESDTGYKLGQRVRHPKFGEGTIVNLEGSGEHSRLQVAFQGQGIKWLVAAYARLEAV